MVAEEKHLRGTCRLERQILMRTVERHRLGMFPQEHRIHTQAEVEVDGVVGAVEVGVAIIGEVRHPEGQTTHLVIGRQKLG